MLNGRDAVVAEWQERAPSSPDEIAAFYRESAHLGEDGEWWHTFEARQSWTAFIADVAKENAITGVLDVGCGSGQDLRALREALGPDAALLGVEPNERLRTALHKDGLRVVADLAHVTEQHFAGTLPRMTILIDVLEHLPDAKGFLDRVLEHVPVGGLLVEATAAFDTSTPLHLPHLQGWAPDGQIRGAGFVLRQKFGERLNFWERMSPPLGVATKTLILVAYRYIEPRIAAQLTQLAPRGWTVTIQTNDALITRARSLAVSRWWRETADDVFLMVDGDVVFNPEDADKLIALAREKRSIVVGAYPVRNGQHLSSRIAAGKEVVFAPDAEPMVIEYGATGFMAVHRDVIDALVDRLPLCHGRTDWSFWPFFDCSVIEHPDTKDRLYLSEDWDFCAKAAKAGFPTWLDPRIRLGHLGTYEYRLEDIGRDPRPDIARVRLRMLDADGLIQHQLDDGVTTI